MGNPAIVYRRIFCCVWSCIAKTEKSLGRRHGEETNMDIIVVDPNGNQRKYNIEAFQKEVVALDGSRIMILSLIMILCRVCMV